MNRNVGRLLFCSAMTILLGYTSKDIFLNPFLQLGERVEIISYSGYLMASLGFVGFFGMLLYSVIIQIQLTNFSERKFFVSFCAALTIAALLSAAPRYYYKKRIDEAGYKECAAETKQLTWTTRYVYTKDTSLCK